MKLKFTPFLTLLFVLIVAGCGKKSVDDDKRTVQKQEKSETELSFELYSDIKTSLETNNLRLFKSVLEKTPGLDLNLILNDGETLLTSVIKSDFREFRDFLIEKGASVEGTNANGETPLIAAALARQANSVNVLMDRFVELNKKDKSGRTALHHSIIMIDDEKLLPSQRTDAENLAILLVKAGASVEITGPEDRNAYRLAVDHKSVAVQEIIRTILETEYGTPDVNTFRSVLRSGDTKTLSFMLTRYPSMPQTYNSINPLVLALDHENHLAQLRMVQLLMNYKVPVNGPEDAETTPLIKSVLLGNSTYVVMFLDAKADVQKLDRTGKSALYYAMWLKNVEVMRILLQAGALVKYRSIDGDFYFDACRMIKGMQRSSRDDSETETLSSMRSLLRCGGIRWLPF